MKRAVQPVRRLPRFVRLRLCRFSTYIDILPALKGEDSYGLLLMFAGWLRRVPGSPSGLTAPLSAGFRSGYVQPYVLRRKELTPKSTPYIPVLKNEALGRIER